MHQSPVAAPPWPTRPSSQRTRRAQVDARWISIHWISTPWVAARWVRLSTAAVVILSLAACATPRAMEGQRPAPYPRSRVITAMHWDLSTVASLRSAYGSDIWPTAWASDGNLYTAWGDGGGFDGTEDTPARGRVSLGFARISGTPQAGSPQSYVGRNVWGMKPFAESQATFGGKIDDLISIDGVLYGQGGLWTAANCGCSDPTQKPESSPMRTLVWSEDLGRNWQIAPWSAANDLGSSLQFGQDYAGALDPARLYLYYQRDVNLDSTHVYLRRVRKDELKIDPATSGHFEYFAGASADGAPRWSASEQQAVAVFADLQVPRGVYATPSVVYDSVLGRYLLTAYHGRLTGMVGFFEAPAPWGPWSTIAYYRDWGGFNATAGEANGVGFPAKWISRDGRELWAIFSGLRTSAENYFDSFNVARAVLKVSARIGQIREPAAQAAFAAGETVRARGSGSGLSWSIERWSVHGGTASQLPIATGAGRSITFSIPSEIGADEFVRITLTSSLGSVYRDYRLRAASAAGR